MAAALLSPCAAGLQAFAYGALDVFAKVFFGWAVILLGPVLRRQSEEEYAK